MKDPLQTHIMKNHFFVEAPIGALLYPELSIQQIFLPKLELPKAKLYIWSFPSKATLYARS